MSNYVIIVAGGKGLRMGSDLPKQFIPVKGLPILMRTMQRFYDYDKNLNIILVLPKHQQDYWKQLCEEYHFDIPHQIADGGETRFHSSANGLSLIPDDAEGLVGIHDGVRPFPSVDVIARCYEAAAKFKAVVPAVPVVETLWKTEGCTEDRNLFRLGQTPQTFDIQLLKRAFRQPYDESFTDDASVVKRYGQPITLIEGNPENIKITKPFDLKVAEALCL
ncbi:MAG: 2-C-methyl-D-erythritol 4-phosphate cytidylyltransferase [Prevotellaceae bacterium]|nr:2-C-methyl-D-erythritol 4-phosphate cytidylyltransferase [Prevotellaceae bacterium]